MNRFFVLALVVLVAMVAALASASPSGHGANWHRAPGSPTARRTIKDGVGQQIDHTHNLINGQRTSGYLALGKNARQDSPTRNGQPSSGGKASTSGKH